MKAGIITAIATLLLLGGGIYLIYQQSKPPEVSAATHELAACLTEKGVKMYGAYWCPHCKAQKELFGAAFDKVTYVECTQETKTCTEQKIESYPTWIFADGTRVSGEQPLKSLAEKAQCTYQE